MKSLLKTITFTYVAFVLSIIFESGIDTGGFYSKVALLVSMGFLLFNVILPRLLEIISFPSKGIFFVVIKSILGSILFFILANTLEGVSIQPTSLRSVPFFDKLAGNADLQVWASVLIFCTLYSIIYAFLGWISAGKHRK